MKILEVDHLKGSVGQGAQASLSFRKNGIIGLTPELLKKCCPESLLDNKEYYLHIYTNDNPKANPEIGIVVDTNTVQGLKIRFDKSELMELQYTY